MRVDITYEKKGVMARRPKKRSVNLNGVFKDREIFFKL